MANEISVSFSMRVVNGTMVETIQPGTRSITQTAIGGPTPGYITVGASEESLTFSELSTLGLLYMENLDTTNYIEFGGSTGVYLGRLKPGEPNQFRLNPGATLFLKANTAACKCIVKAFEN